MTKQEQIEGMAQIIFNSKYKNGDISPLKGANELYNAGYRKIPKNGVIIDKDENPCLSCPVPKSEREIADCSTICGAIQLGIDWKNQCRVLVRDYYRLEQEFKNVRKSIAKEIFRDIFRIIFIQYVDEIGRREKYIDSDLFIEDLRELAKKYGVEEEE